MRRSNCRLLVSALLLAACGDEPPADATGSVGTTGSSGTSGTTGSTGDAPTTGAPDYYESPDCMTLELPGDPVDLASTPRSDRDAEVLALAIDPSRAVASQAHYEVVADDLAAIRALAPELAEIHNDCAYPDGLQMWFHGENQALMLAGLRGEYRGWDCHRAAYGTVGPYLIDGIAVKLKLDGVFSDVVRDAYAALPGFEEVEVTRCRFAECPKRQCEPSGSISLAVTLDGEGALDSREYRFESPGLGVAVYRVLPGQAPELIE